MAAISGETLLGPQGSNALAAGSSAGSLGGGDVATSACLVGAGAGTSTGFVGAGAAATSGGNWDVGGGEISTGLEGAIGSETATGSGTAARSGSVTCCEAVTRSEMTAGSEEATGSSVFCEAADSGGVVSVGSDRLLEAAAMSAGLSVKIDFGSTLPGI